MAPPIQYIQQPPAQVAPPRFPTAAPVTPPAAPLASAAPAAAPASQPPPRTVRGQMPDEPAEKRPALMQLPSPEQLGIASPSAPAVNQDWTGRLQQLGVSSFHFVNLPGGAWQVICLMPTGKPGHQQHLEAQAATPSEAVRLVLDKAEKK